MKKLREKVNAFSWSRNALNQLKADLDSFAREGVSIPTEPGGWWHQYVCPEHHAELLYDPTVSDAHVFECPYGCKLEGEPYRGAWLVFKHQALARYTLQAAAVYAAEGDSRYAELAKSILVRYAAQFPLYPVHPDAQPWMLKGRAFHQALTEAIWSSTLIRGYLLLKDEGVAFDADENAKLNTFFSMLEGSMEQYRHILIYDRSNPESNYTAWLNASLACVYAAKNEEEKLKGLLQGEGGFVHHLTIGVKPDQFEFEGSTYYHIFVLRAYLIVAEMAERFGIDVYHIKGGQGQSLEGMFDVLVQLSNEQGELPALHDGPYSRVPFAREIAEVFEIGFSVYGHEAYLPILAEVNRQMYGSAARTGLEAFIYADDDEQQVKPLAAEERSPILLRESGFAVLRHAGNPLSVLADFGPHGGSHGHYDKLHVTLNHTKGTITPDMGMVPYGSNLRQKWFAETASHNTISVGRRSQAEHEGKCMKYEVTEAATYLWLRSEEAYEGAVIDRHLLLNGELLVDWCQVELKEPADIDWWFHPVAALESRQPQAWTAIAKAAPLGEDHGYNYITPVAVMDAVGQTQAAQWNLSVGDGAAAVGMTQLRFPHSEVMTVSTPGTSVDPSQKIVGLLHRQHAATAHFITVYHSGEPVAVSLLGEIGQQKQIGIQLEQRTITCILIPGVGLELG